MAIKHKKEDEVEMDAKNSDVASDFLDQDGDQIEERKEAIRLTGNRQGVNKMKKGAPLRISKANMYTGEDETFPVTPLLDRSNPPVSIYAWDTWIRRVFQAFEPTTGFLIKEQVRAPGNRLNPVTHKVTRHKGWDFHVSQPKWFSKEDFLRSLDKQGYRTERGVTKFKIPPYSESYGNSFVITGLQDAAFPGMTVNILVAHLQLAEQNGQLLFKYGSTGRSTGPHFHVEIVFSMKECE